MCRFFSLWLRKQFLIFFILVSKVLFFFAQFFLRRFGFGYLCFSASCISPYFPPSTLRYAANLQLLSAFNSSLVLHMHLVDIIFCLTGGRQRGRAAGGEGGRQGSVCDFRWCVACTTFSIFMTPPSCQGCFSGGGVSEFVRGPIHPS